MGRLTWRKRIVIKREKYNLHKTEEKILYSSGMDSREESGYGVSERRQLLWRVRKKLHRGI